MARKKRAKKNKKRGMYKRLNHGKRPMSAEQKKARKEFREAQKEASKTAQNK